jgi:hypothetical protein
MSLAAIGGNNPPSTIEFAKETTEALSEWLKENPVIETEEQARAGKLMVDRAKNTIGDLEGERDSRVRPLNAQVKSINDSYRAPRDILTKVCDTLLKRLQDFALKEERERQAKAAEALRAAEEAERIAREAERIEQEAREDAAAGTLDVDIGAATVAADAAFEAFEKAERAAALAERESRVKIGGGFNRALGLRNKEVLIVDDWQKAVLDMGLTDKISEAILSSAREYRKATGDLPEGIIVETERKL